MQTSEYRLVTVAGVGRMTIPYDIRDLDHAKRLLADTQRRQVASPFPTGGSWLERREGDEWVKVNA